MYGLIVSVCSRNKVYRLMSESESSESESESDPAILIRLDRMAAIAACCYVGRAGQGRGRK